MNKKAALWILLSVIGAVLGIITLVSFSSFREPGKQHLAEDLISQGIEQENNVNSAKAYLEASAKVSVAEAIFALARDGGFQKEPPCGTYNGAAVWQSQSKGAAECAPILEDELIPVFNTNLRDLLVKSPFPEFSSPPEFVVKIAGDQISGMAKTSVQFPSQKLQVNPPFDQYTLTAYADVKCDDAPFNKDFDIALKDTFSQQGVKHIYADLLLTEGSAEHVSFFGVKDQSKLISPDFVGTNPGEYCPPIGVYTVYNLELKTYKDGKELCKISTQRSEDPFGEDDLLSYDTDFEISSTPNLISSVQCPHAQNILQCPGIQATYCGSTGFLTPFSKYPSWDPIFSSNKDAMQSFVRVNEQEIASGRPFAKMLHARTSVVTDVVFDSKIIEKGSQISRVGFWEPSIKTGAMAEPALPKSSVVKSFQPGFKTNLPSFKEDFRQIIDGLGKLTQICGSRPDARVCASEQVSMLGASGTGYSWEIEEVSPELSGFESSDPLKNRFVILRVTSPMELFPYESPLVYRFAVYLSDLPPGIIRDLGALNPKGSNGLLAHWPHAEGDISKFTLYASSAFELAGKKPVNSEISVGSLKAEKIVFEKSKSRERKLTVDCAFVRVGSSCSGLEEEVLYTDAGMYYVLLSESFAQGSIGITATDASGQESAIGSSLQAEPVDRLASGPVTSLSIDEDKKPSFAPPVSNIDASARIDQLKYYYFLKPGTCDGLITIADGFLDATYRTDADGIQATLQASPGSYCIGVLAADTSGNPIEEVSEGSTRLKIREEYLVILPSLVATIET